jgi:hypothetical protein
MEFMIAFTIYYIISRALFVGGWIDEVKQDDEPSKMNYIGTFFYLFIPLLGELTVTVILLSRLMDFLNPNSIL